MHFLGLHIHTACKSFRRRSITDSTSSTHPCFSLRILSSAISSMMPGVSLNAANRTASSTSVPIVAGRATCQAATDVVALAACVAAIDVHCTMPASAHASVCQFSQSEATNEAWAWALAQGKIASSSLLIEAGFKSLRSLQNRLSFALAPGQCIIGAALASKC